jgi:enoyl-CoA hydratase/carnithine racemase
MDSYTLELRIDNRIGRITFGHPSKNAMTSEMLNKLAELIDKANESQLCGLCYPLLALRFSVLVQILMSY